MSPLAITFLTYVWHYILARLLYDDLVRPLARGDGTTVLLGVALTSAAVFVLRRRARRRP
jgi:hypothetical protein